MNHRGDWGRVDGSDDDDLRLCRMVPIHDDGRRDCIFHDDNVHDAPKIVSRDNGIGYPNVSDRFQGKPLLNDSLPVLVLLTPVPCFVWLYYQHLK